MRRKISVAILIVIILTFFSSFSLGLSSVKANTFLSFEDLEELVEKISNDPFVFFTTNFEHIELNEDKSVLTVTLACAEGKLIVEFDQKFNILSMSRHEHFDDFPKLADWVFVIFFLLILAFVIVILELHRKSPHDIS